MKRLFIPFLALATLFFLGSSAYSREAVQSAPANRLELGAAPAAVQALRRPMAICRALTPARPAPVRLAQFFPATRASMVR